MGSERLDGYTTIERWWTPAVGIGSLLGMGGSAAVLDLMHPWNEGSYSGQPDSWGTASVMALSFAAISVGISLSQALVFRRAWPSFRVIRYVCLSGLGVFVPFFVSFAFAPNLANEGLPRPVVVLGWMGVGAVAIAGLGFFPGLGLRDHIARWAHWTWILPASWTLWYFVVIGVDQYAGVPAPPALTVGIASLTAGLTMGLASRLGLEFMLGKPSIER